MYSFVLSCLCKKRLWIYMFRPDPNTTFFLSIYNFGSENSTRIPIFTTGKVKYVFIYRTDNLQIFFVIRKTLKMNEKYQWQKSTKMKRGNLQIVMIMFSKWRLSWNVVVVEMVGGVLLVNAQQGLLSKKNFLWVFCCCCGFLVFIVVKPKIITIL